MRACLVLLAALLAAGCLDQGGSVDRYRTRGVTLAQVGTVEEGIATLQVQAHTPDFTLEDVVVQVDGATLERAPSCPPPEGAWAWCAEGKLRAGETLQAWADPGARLQVVDGQEGGVVLTLTLR